MKDSDDTDAMTGMRTLIPDAGHLNVAVAILMLWGMFNDG